MVNLTDIHALSGFVRDPKGHIERLSETGKPEVLTVNGEARVVVQDVAAYQEILELAEEARTHAAIRQSLAEMERGETVPLEDAMEQIRERLGIEPTPKG